MEYGINTEHGVLKPDPLTAKISPFSQPNTMHLACVNTSYESSKETRYLKTKHLSPVWVKEVIQKKLQETQTKKSVEIDRLLNADDTTMGFCQKSGDNFIEWKMVSKSDRNQDSPTFEHVPCSPLGFCDTSSSDSSSESSPNASPVPNPGSPNNTKMKPLSLLKTENPTEGQELLPANYKVPPLLRPRQVHPCKNKYDEKKVQKKKNHGAHVLSSLWRERYS